jgi:hypothetical protein
MSVCLTFSQCSLPHLTEGQLKLPTPAIMSWLGPPPLVGRLDL